MPDVGTMLSRVDIRARADMSDHAYRPEWRSTLMIYRLQSLSARGKDRPPAGTKTLTAANRYESGWRPLPAKTEGRGELDQMGR